MKHKFLLTLNSEHTGSYVQGALSNRLTALIGDFNDATLDVFHGTAFAAPQRTVPEEVRLLARQIYLFTGVKPATVSLHQDHFKAHDAGGNLTPHEHFSLPQLECLKSLYRSARDITAHSWGLPYTFHLDELFTTAEKALFDNLRNDILYVEQAGLALLFDGQFDTITALREQLDAIVKGFKP